MASDVVVNGNTEQQEDLVRELDESFPDLTVGGQNSNVLIVVLKNTKSKKKEDEIRGVVEAAGYDPESVVVSQIV